MAQYGQGFYGEMYYGVMGAKYGTYVTNTIQTDGGYQFQGDMAIIVTLEDIKANYKVKDQSLTQIDIFSFDSNWTDTGTNFSASAANAVVDYLFTGSNCSLVYSGGPINYAIYTTDENGVRVAGASGSLPANASLAEQPIPTVQYTNYDIKLTCPANTIIDSGYVYVCGTEVDLKAANDAKSLDSSDFSQLQILSQTVSSVPGNTSKYIRKITYGANGLISNSIYKYKLTLFCSDSQHQVYVDEIEVESYNPQLYMQHATYTTTINMSSLADYTNMTDFGVISWTENSPSGSRVEVRTSAGSDLNTAMSPYTPIYKIGGVQARLQPGQTRGWICTPAYNFDVLNGTNNTTLSAVLSNIDIKYSLGGDPKDGYGLTYRILVNGSPAGGFINNAITKDITQYALDVANKKTQVVVNFMNDYGYFSPTIDMVNITSQCIYDEILTKTGLMLSAVEQKKELTGVKSLGFYADSHPYISQATFKISSPDSGINGYKLYFKSTDGINRSDSVTLLNKQDDIMMGFSSLPISTSHRLQNVRFGDGNLQQDNSYLISLKMINNFRDPSIEQGKKYLFRVDSGMSTPTFNGDYYLITPDTSTQDKDSSFSFSSGSIYTSQSTFNGSSANDVINMKTSFNTNADSYKWTSEQKMYSGSVNIFGSQEPVVIEITDLPGLDPGVFFNNITEVDYTKSPQQIFMDAYGFTIAPNSVFCVPKEGSNIPVDTNRIKITQVSLVQDSQYETATTILTRGMKPYRDPSIPSNADEIPALNIQSIDSITQVVNGVTTQYPVNVSWSTDGDKKTIIWATGKPQPDMNTQYSVTYKYLPYVSANVVVECDYFSTDDDISGWTSKYRVPISGQCTTDTDDIQDLNQLAPKNDVNTWPDITDITSDSAIDASSLKYFIYSCDNNFVSSTISADNKLISTMHGINPPENWMLNINTGYYYLGKDEYYKYASNNIVSVSDNIPVMSNCEYIGGADNNSGAIVSHDTIQSVALNNDFNLTHVGVSNNVVPKSGMTFTSDTTANKVFWL